MQWLNIKGDFKKHHHNKWNNNSSNKVCDTRVHDKTDCQNTLDTFQLAMVAAVFALQLHQLFFFPLIHTHILLFWGKSKADSLRKFGRPGYLQPRQKRRQCGEVRDRGRARDRQRDRAWGKRSTGHAYGPLLVSFSIASSSPLMGPLQHCLMAPLPIRMGKAALTKHAQGHWPGNVAEPSKPTH